jgi:hypothetical protein
MIANIGDDRYNANGAEETAGVPQGWGRRPVHEVMTDRFDVT